MVALTLEVPDDLSGIRADRVVALLSDLTRRQVRDLIDTGMVSVRGAPVGHRDPLDAGDELVVLVPVTDERLTAEPVDFGVLFEDDDIAVLDKPAGLVVHPGAGHARGTVVHGMLHRWPGVRGVGQAGRWGIVHRLDRETSGAIVVAKTQAGYDGLKDAVDRRSLTRRYLALVHGAPALPTGTIEAPIGRDPRHPTRMRIRPEGRPAVTHYHLEEELGDYSLITATLETGRTHQIRVHLESIDLPVVGDRIYGRPGRAGIDPGRVWLHAAALEFIHPLADASVAANSPLPPELNSSLAAARRDA